MAFRATAVLQTENLPSDIGKYGGGAGKTDLPKTAKNARQDRRPFGDLSNNRRQGRKPFADLSNTERQNRKPLRDVSNTSKPPVSGPPKGLVLNGNSALRAHGTTKNASKGKLLTDEEIKMCHEWAKEGIELAHFTGNDLQKLQKNVIGNGVKKKVDKVMTAVHEWADVTYDLVLPMKNEISKNVTNVEKMEVEQEILPNSLLPSDNKESDLLCETERHIHPFLECDFVLKMKDDDPCTTSNNDDDVLKMKGDDPGCPSACHE